MFPEDSEIEREAVEHEAEEPEIDQEPAVVSDESSAEEAAAEAVELDPLSQIEERILRAVELVNTLRKERDSAIHELNVLRGEQQQSDVASQALSEEIVALKAERQKVRARLERLLGHIDQLS